MIGEIDSSHGCVKQDIVRQYNHLGGCGFDGERLENIGVVDSASQLVNFLQSQRKDHFGTLEFKKEDSIGYSLVGRYISEYVVDPDFVKESEKIAGSRSYHLVKLIKDENNQWEERKLLFKKRPTADVCSRILTKKEEKSPCPTCKLPSSLHWIYHDLQ